ncbi:MAG: YncE family protein, partial [Candidatus Eremiobacteraeota bacterium]|nr:YncE family protein [Candidatus Eremiobacteraeota bacterium]
MKRIALALALVAASGLVALAALSTPPTLLPTGRSIDAPAGAVEAVGTLPEGLALTPDGARLLVVEGGYKPPALRVLDARTLAELGVVALKGAYGIPLVDPDGRGAWIAGANADALVHVDLAKNAVDRTIELAAGCWPAAVARIDAKTLAAACESAAQVALVDEAPGTLLAAAAVGRHPSALVVAPDRKTLFASAWGERAVDAVDLASRKVVRQIQVGTHPEALALAPDGNHLYVANADDDSLSIVDLRAPSATPPSVVELRLDEGSLTGNSPNALAVAPDGRRLYVAAGAANAVYVLAIGPEASLRRIGAVPSGWYPTAVAATPQTLYVANGYGEGSHSDAAFAPLRARDPNYIGAITIGSIRTTTIPDDAHAAAGDARVRHLAGGVPLRDDPVVRPHGPIEHVI